VSTALLDRHQAAAQLGVSLRTIDNLISSGDLSAIHIGRAVRIRPSALEYFCEANESRRNPKTGRRALPRPKGNPGLN
jgi:excisionase family DNA binding protein